MISLALAIGALLVQDEAAATAALEQFKTDYKAKDAGARASAVATLAATSHDKVYAKLGQLLGLDEAEVRIAAAKGLGGAKAENPKKPMTYLLNGLAPNAKNPPVVAAILEALGKLRQEAALPEIEKHLKARNLAEGKAAVEAVGEIKSRNSIPALIALLKWLEDSAKEAPEYNGGGGGKGGKGFGGGNLPGTGGGGVVDEEARERDTVLRPIVHKVLQSITGLKLSSRKDWEDWYKETGGRGRAEK
jgi:hypothetical protein